MRLREKPGNVTLDIENIGGIDSLNVDLESKLNLLVGENATNRSSVIQSLRAVFGSSATLKTGAEKGKVTLEIAGETFTRTLTRDGPTTTYGGSPVLEDKQEIRKAELFAFLTEDNDIRREVRAGGAELRKYIMEPVNTVAIQTEIDSLTAQRESLKTKLTEIEREKKRLPSLQEKQARLENDITEQEDKLADVRARIDEHETTLETAREEQQELDETLSEIDSLKSELGSVESRIETARNALDKTVDERETVLAELDSIDVATDRLGGLDATIRQLEQERNELESKISNFESIIQFNSKFIDGSLPDASRFVDTNGESERDHVERVTRQLADDQVACWTCGSEVPAAAIDDTLDDLRGFVEEKRAELSAIERELADCKNERDELQSERQKRERLSSRVTTLDEKVKEREEKVTDLEQRQSSLEEEIETLDQQLGEIELDESDDEFLELHQEASQLERELGNLEQERQQVVEEIEGIETKVEDSEAIDAQITELSEEISSLRTKIDTLESDIVEKFNTHMESLVGHLDYENIARIWIEQKSAGSSTRFELHIVREVAGTMHEDTIETLSESERELVGLVLALAGYLAFEVRESAPLIVLDSVEAIDATRLGRFADYIADHSEFVVGTLLPEDEAAMPADANMIHFGQDA